MPFTVPPVVAAGRLATQPQPTITLGPDLLLRPWTEADVDVACAAFAEPDIRHWHGRRLDTEADGREWIAGLAAAWTAETGAHWAIVSGGPEPVGRVALTLLDLGQGWGEVSYWLRAVGRGRGLATHALDGLATWAFDDLGLHRLDLLHSVANAPSCAVANRAGFAAEGVARQALLHDDGWHDLHRHGRLATDPRPVIVRG